MKNFNFVKSYIWDMIYIENLFLKTMVFEYFNNSLYFKSYGLKVQRHFLDRLSQSKTQVLGPQNLICRCLFYSKFYRKSISEKTFAVFWHRKKFMTKIQVLITRFFGIFYRKNKTFQKKIFVKLVCQN